MDKKIIIFTDANIGDFIWATSAISLVKQTNKDCTLTLITFDSYVPLIDKKLEIDNIIVLKQKYYNAKNKFIKYTYKIYCFLKNYFDIKKHTLIIFLDQNITWAILSKYFYKIKNIVGPNTSWCGFNIQNPSSKYFTKIITMPMNSDKTHMIVRYQTIIRSCFNVYNLAIPILPNTLYTKNKIINYLKDSKKYKIALCLLGNNKLNNWNIENWKNLIIKLSKEENITFYILGNTNIQYKQAEYLINSLKQVDIKNICKRTNLLELKEFIKAMNLIISIDTGVAHIAATTNIPEITIHGITLPEQSMPINYNSKQICLYKKCSPCNHKILYFNDICKNNVCLKDISSDLVCDIAKQMLGILK